MLYAKIPTALMSPTGRRITEEEFRVLELIEAERQEQIKGADGGCRFNDCEKRSSDGLSIAGGVLVVTPIR